MRRLPFLLITACLLLAACGGGGTGASTSSPTPAETTPPPEDDCPAQTTLVMNTRSFDPICLEVARGTTLALENNSDVPHTFTLDKPEVDVVVDAGASGEYEVTDLKRREYRFFCRFHLVMTVRVVVT